MCGINCIIDLKGLTDDSIIERMNAATSHRGPDSSGTQIFFSLQKKFLIGSNRLRINDPLPRSDQPFISSCGNHVLAYNGEIYNKEELIKQLPDSVKLKTQGDTEILLELLIYQGTSCLQKINGMFALVYINKITGKVIAARDQHGIKPLYHTENKTLILFSSEIRGILSSGLIRQEFNEKALDSYLNLRYASPGTFYKNINPVPPGYFIEINNKVYRKESFVSDQIAFDKKISLKTVEEALTEAVTKEFSNQDIALMLSGGVDSTLLLALAAGISNVNIKAFTISLSEKDLPFGTKDTVFAKLAAKKFGVELVSIPVSINSFNDFADHAAGMDQPIADPASFLTAIMSKEIRNAGFKIAASGAGADELFAGYNRHSAYNSFIRNKSILLFLKPFLKKMPIRGGFQKGIEGMDNSAHKTWLNFLSLQNKTNLLLPEFQFDNYHKGSTVANLKDALTHDKNCYLVNDVLAITDQMSMKYGLEVRVPFLDKELVELAKSASTKFLMKNGKKWILKEILNKHGGNSFSKRSKEGFGVPLNYWLRKKEGRCILQWLENRKNPLYNYINFDLTEAMIKTHVSGKVDYGHFIWGLASLSVWMQDRFQ